MKGDSPVRYMVRDLLSLDDIAYIQLTFPTRLTRAELDDVQAWFALRVRGWERSLLPPARGIVARQGGDAHAAPVPQGLEPGLKGAPKDSQGLAPPLREAPQGVKGDRG